MKPSITRDGEGWRVRKAGRAVSCATAVAVVSAATGLPVESLTARKVSGRGAPYTRVAVVGTIGDSA